MKNMMPLSAEAALRACSPFWVLVSLCCLLLSVPGQAQFRHQLCADAYLDVAAFHFASRQHDVGEAEPFCSSSAYSMYLNRELTNGPAYSLGMFQIDSSGLRADARMVLNHDELTASASVRGHASRTETLVLATPFTATYRGYTARAILQVEGRCLISHSELTTPPSFEVELISFFRRGSSSGFGNPIARQFTRSGPIHITEAIPVTDQTETPAVLFLIGATENVTYDLTVRRFVGGLGKPYFKGSGFIDVTLGSSLGWSERPDPGGVTPQRALALEPPPPGVAIRGFQFLKDGQVVDIPPGHITVTSATGVSYPIFGPVLPSFQGADDFSRSEVASHLWGQNQGTGAFQQENGRLNFVSSSAAQRQGLLPFVFSEGRTSQHWTLTAAVHLADLPFSETGQGIEAGLQVTDGTHTASLTLARRRSANASVLEYAAATSASGAQHSVNRPASGSEPLLRLTFDGRTGTLAFWADPDGHAGPARWMLLGSQVQSPTWAPGPQARFRASLLARSEEVAVPAGSIWIDDFSATSFAPIDPAITGFGFDSVQSAVFGRADPGASVVLEASSDLQSWAPLPAVTADHDATFVRTLPAAEWQFFRIRR